MNNENDQRTIWITGSRGFIGIHLVTELEDMYNLELLTNSKSADTSIDHDYSQPRYVDFQNEKNIHELIENLGLPDIFIHLGWGDMLNPHSEMHLGTNVSQSKNLIKVLYEAGLDKFVFLGSMNEYGDQVGTLYEEMGPRGWITNYAKGKIKVASYGFEKAKEMNKQFIHIRLFYTYGPMKKRGSLIQDLYHGYKKNSPISLGSCEQYRDYIHISDVVKGIRLLCDVDESTIVNLGSGKAIQLKEFVYLFWRTLGGKKEMLHFGEKSVGKEQPQPNCFASLDKLQKLTGGWKPSVQIEDGVKLTIRELDKMYSTVYAANTEKIT